MRIIPITQARRDSDRNEPPARGKGDFDEASRDTADPKTSAANLQAGQHKQRRHSALPKRTVLASSLAALLATAGPQVACAGAAGGAGASLSNLSTLTSPPVTISGSTATISGDVSGGDGGTGDGNTGTAGTGTDANGGDGDGGNGGSAVNLDSATSISNVTVTGASIISGGNGGGGSNAGGDGGNGINRSSGSDPLTITNAGTISGGDGGDGTGTGGHGGTGISGQNLTVINSGTISGGPGGPGGTGGTDGTNGAAIHFTGGTNRLELRDGSTITGSVLANEAGANDTLVLGGINSPSLYTFDANQLGPGEKYSGFKHLEKTGTSKWLLTGSYSGITTTTISGGALLVGNSDTSGSISGDVTNNAALNFRPNNQQSFTGTISGTGSLTKGGAGTLTLTGANSYAGGTFISGGTLQVSADANLGDAASRLLLYGGALQVTGTDFNATDRTIVLGTSGGTFDINDSDNNFTVPTSISSSNVRTASLTKTGAGTLTLTGTNHYAGDTLINGGTLQVSADANLGTAASGLSLNGGTLQVTGTDFQSTGRTITLGNAGGGFDIATADNDFTVAQDLTGDGSLSKRGTGTLTLTGTNTYSGGTTITAGTLQVGNGSTSGSITGDVTNNGSLVFNRISSQNFAGAISGSGSLTKSGAGTLTLTGANTYAGPTFITGGTLQVGDGGSITSNANVTNNTALIFNSSSTQNLASTISGSGSLTKAGTGTLTLTGANTYTGTTTINGGTLQIGDGGTSGSITSDVTNHAMLTFNRSGTLRFAGAISGSGSLTKKGTGTLTLAGANTYTGDTLINDGTLQVSADTSLGDTASRLSLNGGTLQVTGTGFTTDRAITLDGSGGTLAINDSGSNLTVSRSISGSGNLTKAGAGTLTLVGINNAYTGTTINGGTLQIGNGGTSGSLTGDVTNNGSLVFNRISSQNFAGAISGSGSLTKSGAGTLTLTGANTYAGPTFITGGTLQVGDGGSITSNANVTNNTALIFNSSSTQNLASTISGNGSLTKAGTGTLTLTGANTYTGTTTINGGTLQIGDGGTSGSITSNVTNHAMLTFNRSGTLSFAGAISGSGSLTKKGTGTLTLAGANTYTGDTLINDGTLQVSADTSLGDTASRLSLNGGTLQVTGTDFQSTGRTITLGNAGGGFDIATADNDFTVAQDLTGDGSLSKRGTGTLTLTGTNTYSGGTTITAGTLQVGNGSTSGSITGDVTNNGSLVFNRISSQNFAGAISGSGSLTKSGAGTLTLTGANTYAGPTFITGGTLQVGDGGSITSNANVTNNTALIFNSSSTQNLASTISGNGSLTKAGTGTLTLTGANTYTGTTTINGGTLQIGDGGTSGSITSNVTNHAMLTFNRSGTLSFAGVISGSGTLTKTGAGRLTLTKDNSSFSGTTMVEEGLLTVGLDSTARLGGTITVADGGTLGGHGTITGSVTVQHGGTLAPGGSIGITTMTDTLALTDSIYEVELKSGGNTAGVNNDLTQVTGAVTISGGTVHVLPENRTEDGSTYTPGLQYTIVTSEAGVNGAFSNLTDDYAFLNFTLAYDPHDVYLVSSLNDLCRPGFTSNQCAAARTVGTSAPAALTNAVLALNEAEAPQAINRLSGEVHASVQSALIDDSRFSREAVTTRLRNATGGVGADPKAGDTQRLAHTAVTLWGHGFGSWGHWDGNSNAAQLKRSIGGMFLGIDAPVTDQLHLGLVGSISRSSFDVDDRSSSGSATSYRLGVYGGGQWNALSLRFGTLYGWHTLNTNRSVTFRGFSDQLSADYNARSIQAFAEIGYRFDYHHGRLEPYAGMAYVHLRTDGFTEHGGDAALSASSRNTDTTFTTLGLRTQIRVWAAQLRDGIAWRHALGDVTPTVTHAFAAGGDDFTVSGVPVIGKDAAQLDVGLYLPLSASTTLSAAYDGQFGSGGHDQGITATLAMKF